MRLRDYTRSRSFPTTRGRLLKAEIGGDSEGFAPVVEFEYEVDGALYTSCQLSSNPVRVMKNRTKNVQPEIDRLRAEPNPLVYYNPRAPWDGFLQHGGMFVACLPVFLGLIFAALGVAILVWRNGR